MGTSQPVDEAERLTIPIEGTAWPKNGTRLKNESGIPSSNVRMPAVMKKSEF